MDMPYSYIEASSEKELLEKLIKISVAKGWTYKIINIYPKGKKVVAWYYASKKTQ